MVTGFNTEVVHEGIVYHIQTETRRDTGIETAVYVRGAIIHSVKTNYEDLLKTREDAEQILKKRLEEQHRDVINRIRAGEIRSSQNSQPGSPARPQGA